MIVVKETNGRLYVADIGPAKSASSPGDILQDWTPIGPGTNPTVSWDGTIYYIAFEYLGHVYVRKMDSTVWPPEVIDPTTYTPNISLEEPQDAMAFGVRSTTLADMNLQDDGYNTKAHTGFLERQSGMIYDLETGQMSTTLRRNTGTSTPTPATFKAWRVYKRTPAAGNTPAGPWELLADWQPEVGLFTLSSMSEINMELTLTFGRLWTDAGINTDPALTGLYQESIPGSVLVVNSNVEPKTFQVPFGDQIPAIQGASSPFGVWFSSSQEFYSYPAYDTINVPATQQTSAVIPDLATPPGWISANYSDPGGLSDSLNLSQGQNQFGLIVYT